MNANKLREAALALPAEERARLAHVLLGSLGGPEDPDASEAWVSEIERRATEVADDTVRPVDWGRVRERVRRRLRGRSA
jgi:putative addiction module component (TIGR02574 family)